MKVTIQELSQSLGLNITGGDAGSVISQPLTDSRSLGMPGSTLFFALTTSSNDGHRYVRDLYRRGVRHFVINRSMMDQLDMYENATYIVADGQVLDVLQATAAYIRGKVHCPVVGITGSRGKTVMKEMLSHALGDRVVLCKSPRSWNSQSGVPMSVWRLEPDTELGIFEAGISKAGEMARLERVIRPDVGVFTGLTDEHSHGFGSMEQKCREKAQLFINCHNIIYIDNNELIGQVLRECCPNATLHRVTNFVEAVEAVGAVLNVEMATDGLERYEQLVTRIDISDGEEGNTFAYDHYTNDLDGIETALDFIARRLPGGTPLITVLGNLDCHGIDKNIAYCRLEQLLSERNVDGIIAVGEEISEAVRGFSKIFSKYYVADSTEFIKRFKTGDFPGSALLIKGSPFNGFERIKSWLEDTRHDTCLEVNLESLVHNFNYYRSLVKPSTGVVCMVKADAYGAGAVEVSRMMQSQGADYLAVAVVEEGLKLRRAGVTMPVMVLNPISSNYVSLFNNKLEPTIFSLRELEILSSFVPDDVDGPFPIHVKLDTGMHRFGFSEDELPQFVEEIKRYPQFRIQSVFSHLATADCCDMDDYTEFQLNNFDRMSSFILSHLDYNVKRHVLNTAGIMRFGQYQYDMVRLGIGLYGISPMDNIDTNLEPVSSLTTCISALQTRHEGETVGYGRRGLISGERVIATIPIGYADGLNRHLGNGHLSLLVNGCQCPTVGNICMDISMVDVTDAHARCGDRIEIFGRNNRVERVAQQLDTIPYEVLTSVSQRVKRVYYRE
ncbi:MAG: alanine racemase [Clostridiales bacterium]|nr:alanine racemase [Clostridiales bacterium]